MAVPSDSIPRHDVWQEEGLPSFTVRSKYTLLECEAEVVAGAVAAPVPPEAAGDEAYEDCAG